MSVEPLLPGRSAVATTRRLGRAVGVGLGGRATVTLGFGEALERGCAQVAPAGGGIELGAGVAVGMGTELGVGATVDGAAGAVVTGGAVEVGAHEATTNRQSAGK